MNGSGTRTVLVLLASVALTGGIAHAVPPGELDPTFGAAGIAVVSELTRAVAAMSLANDVVVAGSRPDEFALVRLHSDGGIDSSFGAFGVSAVHVGSNAETAGAIQQPDARVVVAGSVMQDVSPACVGCPTTLPFMALVRFDPDGGVDASFGAAGVVVGERGDCAARAVRRQPDGHLLVAGRCGSDFAVIRVGADGMLDQSFGAGGVATAPGRDGATDLLSQPDGSVITIGAAPGDGIRIVRFHPDGTVDPAFGLSAGITDVASDDWEGANAVAQTPDCRLVVAGWALAYNSILNGKFPAFAVIGFTLQGTIDPVLGTKQFQLGLPSSRASAVVPDGSGIVVAGRLYKGFAADGLGGLVEDYHFGLLRLRADGQPDNFFGTYGSGSTETDVPGGHDDDPTSLTTQPDGSFLVAGASGGRGVVARYTPSAKVGSTTTTMLPCTTANGGSTTTTTLPCTTAKCVLDAALGSAACASEHVPRRITKKIGHVEKLIDRATSGSTRVRNLRRKVTKLLSAASRAARKAAKGRHPKLAAACADAIVDAADRVTGDL